MNTTVRLLIAGFLVGFSVIPVSAQSFQGGLRGAVRDVDGVIPGADVILTNEDTNNTRRSTTNAVGEYAFPGVLPGTYTVAAAAPGFRPFESSGIRIGTQTFITLDITLEVGSVTQAVVVTGQAPLMDKTNASVASMLDRSTLETLPTAGRNPFFLAVTTPNVVPVGNPQFVRQQDQDNSSRLSLGGGPVRANNYLLDSELPGALHALGRVNLAKLPALVAHLRRHLQDLRLQLAQVGMAPEMLEALAHAVELALQAEAAVPVGGMRRLVGLRDVPHRDPEASVRVLETHHPIVHRDEEAEAEKEQRQGELNGKPGVESRRRPGRHRAGATGRSPTAAARLQTAPATARDTMDTSVTRCTMTCDR